MSIVVVNMIIRENPYETVDDLLSFTPYYVSLGFEISVEFLRAVGQIRVRRDCWITFRGMRMGQFLLNNRGWPERGSVRGGEIENAAAEILSCLCVDVDLCGFCCCVGFFGT